MSTNNIRIPQTIVTNKTDHPIDIPPLDRDSIPALKLDKEERRILSTEHLEIYNTTAMQEKGEIELLVIQPETGEQYSNMVNQTARRISIRAKEGDKQLIIPAFGSRRLAQSVLDKYDYEPWQQGNLVEINPERKEEETTISDRESSVLAYTFMWLVGAPFLYSAFVEAIPILTRWYWPVYAVVALLGLMYGFGGGSAFKRAGQSLNLLLLFAISLGIPAMVIFFFGDGAALLRPPVGAAPSQALLGRGMQIFFITMLASLPGLLYFQYERQQVTTLRDKFLREIMLLNPSVHTIEDAEIMYGSMVDEISGVVGASSRQYYLLGAGRPILLATLIVTLGWLLTLLPVGIIDTAAEAVLFDFLAPAETAIVFAFLGAYFFALNLIFRRYTRGDLTPKAYTHITVRILSAIILVWVISVAANLGGSNLSASPLLLLVAFGVGIFPETGLVVLQDAIQKRSLQWAFRSLREQHPITRLEGVNLYDYVRLLEEGVENIENLAHYNLIELMLRSRLPTSRLVDMVDQAILYLHVSGALDEDAQEAPDDGEDRALRLLRSYGIRTATDLVRVVEVAGEEEKKRILALLGPNKKGHPQRLNLILHAIQDDEWLDYLQYWRELNRSYGQIYSWEDFYTEEGMRLRTAEPVADKTTPVPAIDPA